MIHELKLEESNLQRTRQYKYGNKHDKHAKHVCKLNKNLDLDYA